MMRQQKQERIDKPIELRRTKKNKRSSRNRHTGVINFFKGVCISKGKRFTHRGNMYSLFQHRPKPVIIAGKATFQRMGTTLVRIYDAAA